MLERARACLTSGARDSLRCTSSSSAPRSRRTLHSAFWTHGAGDLDFPPYPPSSIPTASERQPSSDSEKRSGHLRVEGGGAGSRLLNNATDAPFLDFLYPPQALAWLHGATTAPIGGKPRDWWEKRNSKRLPEGFVQVTRRYASTSHATASSELKVDRETCIDEDFISPDDTAGHSMQQSYAYLPGESILPGHQHNGESMGQNPTSESALDMTEHYIPPFGDFPADLVHAVKIGSEGMLRNIISSTRGRLEGSQPSQDATSLGERAWKIYSQLQEQGEATSDIKAVFLEWLVLVPDASFDTRRIDIYDSISSDKTMDIHKAAVEAHLRIGQSILSTSLSESQSRFDKALEIYRQVLQDNPTSAVVLRKSILWHAVDHANWHLFFAADRVQVGLTISRDDAESKKRRNHSEYKAIKSDLAEYPLLLNKARSLLNYLKKLDSTSLNWQMKRLGSAFVALAVRQEFKFKEPENRPKSLPKRRRDLLTNNVRGVLDSAVIFGPLATQVHRTLLWKLLKPDTPHERRHSNTAVKYLLTKISVSKEKDRISQDFLKAAVQRLCAQKPFPKADVDNLLSNWTTHYGKPSVEALKVVLVQHAYRGAVHDFKRQLIDLRKHYPGLVHIRGVLWTTIYVHARRFDLNEAKAAFHAVNEEFAEHSEKTPLKCHNVLLHAMYRADDLDGALSHLQLLLDGSSIADEYSFHPILAMLGKRGDVAGVDELIDHYDRINTSSHRPTSFLGALLDAHVRAGNIDEAKDALMAGLVDWRAGKLVGSMTESFNILLTGYAMARNIGETMKTYEWMKAEGLSPDALTFSALMQILCHFRVPDRAHNILMTVMEEEKVQPSSFHYAILMHGYSNIGMYQKALDVHAKMKANRIAPSINSKIALLQAESKSAVHLSDESHVSSRDRHERLFAQAMTALETAMQPDKHDSVFAMKQPLLGSRGISCDAFEKTIYFDALIQIYGKELTFEAFSKLYHRYRNLTNVSRNDDDEEPAYKIIESLMAANLRAKNYKEVERYWHFAKAKADQLTHLPSVSMSGISRGQNATEYADYLDVPDNTNFSPKSEMLAANNAVIIKVMRRSSLAPGRVFILSNIFRQYTQALAAQDRHLELISVFSKLIRQGYKFDNDTWNLLICTLCRADPPMVLLAFTLVERFMIESFPGWAPMLSPSYTPPPSAMAQKLQYIRARNLSPKILMVQYPTLINLAGAMMRLSRIESYSRASIPPEAARFMGSVSQVRDAAPKTMFAVQTIPRRQDKLQREILNRDD